MNIIVCSSPLQVLIAERIVMRYPQEVFHGLYYSYSHGLKVEYYYERLARMCAKAELVIPPAGHRSPLAMYRQTLKLLCRGLRLPRASRLFIASFDILDVHLLLVRQGRAQVITYDDGSINLSPEGFKLVMHQCPGALHCLLVRYAGVPTMDSLMHRSEQHYSIYDQPNVMGHVTYLPLFDLSEEVRTYSREVSILLGQPIYEQEGDREVCNAKNKNVTESIVRLYRPDLYCPHPREEYVIDGVEYLHTPLVFEEYILAEMVANPDTHYRVYTYCSSAALNLQGCGQVEFVSLKPSDSPPFLDETYALLARLGVRVEPVEVERLST